MSVCVCVCVCLCLCLCVCIPWRGPFFWYRLLGSVCLSHSDGFSIRSCLEGVSCSLYSQK